MPEEIELSENELLSAIKEAGLEKSFSDYLQQELQKEGDRRVSKGIESFKKNQEQKNLTDKERLESLEKELQELQGTLSKKTLETQIKAELKAQNLNEELIKYVKVEDPTKENAIVEAVGGLKTDLLKLSQEQIDSKLKGQQPPAKGTPGEGGSGNLENYIERKNKGEDTSSPFKGKLKNK